jgi:hypothetical protein
MVHGPKWIALSLWGILAFFSLTPVQAVASLCAAEVRREARYIKIKDGIFVALKAYDRDALLKIARANSRNLHLVNRAIQEALADYSRTHHPLKPRKVLIGAGTTTAMLAATLTETLSERARKNMVILESSPYAVGTFYGKNFILNSPTISTAEDANYVPHGIFQHTDLFVGRPPHSDETAFVMLANLWFSKIPVVFNAQNVQVESRPRGLAVHYKVGAGPTIRITGIGEVGLGTGPGKQNLTFITHPDKIESVQRALDASAAAPNLQTKGIYSTLSFLSAARAAPYSRRLLPHELTIIGHAHSAYTVAEAIMKLWEKTPSRFKQKPRITFIGAQMTNAQEFLEDVRRTSPNQTQRQIFIDRYSSVLPKYFDDKSVVGIDGRANQLQINNDGSISMGITLSVSKAQTIPYNTSLVVLASGNDLNWQDVMVDFTSWEPVDVWSRTIAPHTIDSAEIPDEPRPVSRRYQMPGHTGRLWVYGNASLLLRSYASPVVNNLLITGAPKSLNAMGPQIEAFGQIFSGLNPGEDHEPETQLHPGASLLNGF